MFIFTLPITNWGRRMIGISESLIWSKTLMELIFNPCGEFRWSPEGPVSQIPLSAPPRWCPWDLFRSFNFCSDAKERMGCGKKREATAPIQSLVKLQPWSWACGERTSFDRTAAMVPALAVNDLPLGRTLWWWLLLWWYSNKIWRSTNQEFAINCLANTDVVDKNCNYKNRHA